MAREIRYSLSGYLKFELETDDPNIKQLESLVPDTVSEIFQKIEKVEETIKTRPNAFNRFDPTDIDALDAIYQEYPVESAHYWSTRLQQAKQKKIKSNQQQRIFYDSQLEHTSQLAYDDINASSFYIGALRQVFSKKARELDSSKDMELLRIVNLLIGAIEGRKQSLSKRVKAGRAPENPARASLDMGKPAEKGRWTTKKR